MSLKLKFIISAVLLIVGTNMITDDTAAARGRMEMSRHMRDFTLVFVEREDPSAVDMVSRSLAKASFPKISINRSRFAPFSMVLVIVGLLLPFTRFRRAVPPTAQSATSS
ncbi:MAG TPA: hypothetical protein VGE39_08845 [Prosthecobacter sp.]